MFICRCKQWVVNSRTANLDNKTPAELYKNYALCAAHFESRMFMNATLRNKLVHNAVPTIFTLPQSMLKTRSERKRPAERSTALVTMKMSKHSVQETVGSETASTSSSQGRPDLTHDMYCLHK